MNSHMSDMYCIPWGERTNREQIAIDKRARKRKRLQPGERLWRMIERGRRPTLSQVRHELLLDNEEVVLQLVLGDDRLDVRTREFWISEAGNKIHTQEVILAGDAP